MAPSLRTDINVFTHSYLISQSELLAFCVPAARRYFDAANKVSLITAATSDRRKLNVIKTSFWGFLVEKLDPDLL